MIGMVASVRAFSAKALKVVNDIAKQQFVVSMKGAEATISYELEGKKTITFVRTDVPDQFRGQGVGKILAKGRCDVISLLKIFVESLSIPRIPPLSVLMTGMITRARAFSTGALKVVNNVARQQFVVSLKGADAALTYQLKDNNSITFISTDVPVEFQGRGVGKLLAKYAFDHVLENDMDVICKCHFLSKFYEDNLVKYNKLRISFDLE